MNELGQKILDAIKGCTAQRPMHEQELIRHVRVGHDRVVATVRELQNMHLVNTCTTERDGQMFLEVWPTGLVPGTVKTMEPVAKREQVHLTGPAKPKEDAPKAEPEPRSYVPRGVTGKLVEIIGNDGPITGSALSEKAGIGSGDLWARIKVPIDRGLVVKRKFGQSNWYMTPEQTKHFNSDAPATLKPPPEIQKSVPTTQNAVTQAEADEVPPPAVPKTAARVVFSISDDGALTIVDDSTVLRIEPSDALRLAEFMAYCAPVFGL